MQAKTRFLVPLLALSAGVLAAGAAQAQSHTLKLGGILYDTNAKTSGITGPGLPAGADATVGDATTLLLTYEYALTPKVGVELVLGVPPTLKAKGAGTVGFLGEVVTAKILAPTLFFTYHFGEATDTLRPYAGIGMNYTRFTDVKTPYGWDVRMSDSSGAAVHAGVDWRIGRNWGAFASVAALEVRTRLVATGATVLQSTIDFRPVTYSAGVFYKF